LQANTAGTGYTLTSTDANTKLTLMFTGTANGASALATQVALTINAPLVFGAAASSIQTVTASANLTLNGVLSSTNAITLTFNGASTGGRFILNGANTYSGTTNFTTTGNVVVGNAAAFGTSTLNIGQTVNLVSGTTLTGASAIANSINLSAPVFMNATAGSFEFSGNVNLQGAQQKISFGGGNTTTFSGVLSNDAGAGLSIIGGTTGNSILALSGTNTYTGNTVIATGSASLTTMRVSVDSIGNAGVAGNLGAGSKITLGDAANPLFSAGLRYTGTGETTNRTIDLATSTGNIYLEAAGTGALILTHDLTASGAGSKTLFLTGTSTAANEISGAIVDNSGTNTTAVTKNSTGVWTLSGANTFSGGVTVTGGGLLNLNSATAVGAAGGVFTIGAGTIDNTSGAAITLINNNPQVWNANFAFAGTNDLNLGTGAVSMNASRTVTVNGGTLTVGGIISGAAFGLTKAGVGTLLLSGANTFTGNATITAGTLIAANNAALGAGTIALNGGTLQGNGTARTFTNAGTMSGNGGTLGGASDLTFNTGAWTLTNNGILNVTNTGATAMNGDWGLSVSAVAHTLTTNVASGASLTMGGVISDNGALGTAQSGSVAKSGAGVLTLTGANTYSGTTSVSAGTLNVQNTLATTGVTVSGGTLALSGAGTLGSGAVTVSGGTVNLGAKSITNTLGALTGGSVTNGTITNNGGNYDVQSGSVGAVLAGTNGLSKSGGGTVTLSGANTYTGDTMITGGTLALTGSFANSPVIYNNGTLDVSGVGGGFAVGAAQTLQGTGTVIGNTTINGTFSPGNSPGVMTFTGNLTLAGISNFEINGLVRGTDYDGVDVTGALTYGGTLAITFGAPSADGAAYQLFNFSSGATGNFSNVSLAGSYVVGSLLGNAGVWTGTSGGFDFTFTQATGMLSVAASGGGSPVPEPSTYAVIAGLLALGLAVYRRRRCA
jgi:autotransporter-associated beta strand protein